MQLTENGVGSLNISWSKVMIQGLVLDYTVVYMKLENTSAPEPVNVRGIRDQYFIFTQELENNSSCEIYSFQVISVNSVGVSRQSDTIIWSLPTIPVAPVLLEHSLLKKDGAFVLHLTINVGHKILLASMKRSTKGHVASLHNMIIHGVILLDPGN